MWQGPIHLQRLSWSSKNIWHSQPKYRVQYTSIDLKKSSTKIVSHGVPQGSVRGPLLFIILINDLNKSVKNSKVYDYADDTNLLLTEK